MQIDESLCGKLKFGRGDPSKRRRTWVFGGVSRNTGKAFAIVCPKNKRTKTALFPILQAKIKAKTMIFSDGWRPYRKIPTLGFRHRWIDHSLHYVDPKDRNLHTNTIEGSNSIIFCSFWIYQMFHCQNFIISGLWGTMKRFFPNAGPYNLEQYISMFLWFRMWRPKEETLFGN